MTAVSRRAPPWWRVCAALAVVLLCLLGLRRLEWRAVGDALRHARLWPVLLAALINFVHIGCKSELWWTLLRPLQRVSRLRLYQYLIVSYSASIVLPARAGEALRVYLLRRRDGVPVAASVGVILIEKLFEVIGLLLLVAPLPWLLPLPRAAKVAVGAVALGGLGGTAVAVWVARGSSGRLRRLSEGLASVRQLRTFAAASMWALCGFLTDFVEVSLILYAVGVEVPWAAPALVLLTLNLAIAVPSTPAQVGAFEAGAVAGLQALGVGLAPALAFAIVYHVMQVVPILLCGLSGIRLVTDARKEELETALSEEAPT